MSASFSSVILGHEGSRLKQSENMSAVFFVFFFSETLLFISVMPGKSRQELKLLSVSPKYFGHFFFFPVTHTSVHTFQNTISTRLLEQ